MRRCTSFGPSTSLTAVAYSAFDADVDDFIDETDVELGLRDQNGALAIIGNIYYKSQFGDAALNECDRAVLRCLAADYAGWTTRDQIFEKVKAEKDQVGASVKKLTARQLISRDRTGAARFAFTEKTFGLWIARFEAMV